LEIHPQELVVVIGKNGSGKSSLLRCLSGWNREHTGSVLLQNKALGKFSAKERAGLISLLPQHPRLTESIPVLDVITTARYRFTESHATSRTIATGILERNGLSHFQDRDWNTLSGGEAQQIALVCLEAQNAQIWLLDEPANHLDPAVQIQIYNRIIQEWQQGRTIILVTHNINLVLQTVPQEKHSIVRVVGIDRGTISFDSTLHSSDCTEKIGKLYGLAVDTVSAFGATQLVFGSKP
jgi:iron complex transport system ATP-binding protein